jgi:auxin influx carrier (AUX1 LAX family)
VFIPSFHNYRIWSFLGLVMTTYTAWYLAVASLIHGQVRIRTHKCMIKQAHAACSSIDDADRCH